MFDSTKDDLDKILEKARDGKIQLPEFQRDYVWNDDDVRSLLASVAHGYPIGAILTLENGGEVSFKPRPLAGFSVDPDKVEVFLLDGQQRMTSLCQSLFSDKPVKTLTKRNTKIERYYYIDIEKAVAGLSMDDAIIGVPADRIIRSNFGRDVSLDLSSPEQEYAERMFPLNQVFDSRDWSYGWRDYARNNSQDIHQLDNDFFRNIVRRIEKYEVPIIQLNKSNGRAAICQVFEKVNVGGKKLDVFELVTAIYAGDDFDLREDWFGVNGDGRKQKIEGERGERQVLSNVGNTDFLQACTLLHTRNLRLEREKSGASGKELPAISCKRDALLQLPLAAYKEYANFIEEGFRETSHFLNERKIFQHKDIPYPPQMVTLSAVFAILGTDGLNDKVRRKLDRWFWCTTFGELYGSSTETKIAIDVAELVAWCRDGKELPRSVENAYFQKNRLNNLRTRNSAAYKGLHALLMTKGCQDFVSGRPAEIATFFQDRLDIHHIFPQHWCKNQGISKDDYDSIINKTPLSKRTNIRVGGDAPSVYLQRITEKDGIEQDRLKEILKTHLIQPDLLEQDDFVLFFKVRGDALALLIGEAMGKDVFDEEGTDEPEEDAGDMFDEGLQQEETV